MYIVYSDSDVIFSQYIYIPKIRIYIYIFFENGMSFILNMLLFAYIYILYNIKQKRKYIKLRKYHFPIEAKKTRELLLFSSSYWLTFKVNLCDIIYKLKIIIGKKGKISKQWSMRHLFYSFGIYFWINKVFSFYWRFIEKKDVLFCCWLN